MCEPDWQALADLEFLLYSRISDSLNAALTSIALSDMPEARDKPPGFWQKRASTRISNTLNLFTAWSYLIRYKIGEGIPERALRPFMVNSLLEWLSTQLQLPTTPTFSKDLLLRANQASLQEALMLLYSVAFTQGSGVRLDVETVDRGVWFRIRFSRLTPLPSTLDELIASFGDHWRSKDAVFELTTARDFVRLNGSELLIHASEGHGEFAFFIRAAAVASPAPPAEPEVQRHTGPLPSPGETPAIREPNAQEGAAAPTSKKSTDSAPAKPAVQIPSLSELRPTPLIRKNQLPQAAPPKQPTGQPGLDRLQTPVAERTPVKPGTGLETIKPVKPPVKPPQTTGQKPPAAPPAPPATDQAPAAADTKPADTKPVDTKPAADQKPDVPPAKPAGPLQQGPAQPKTAPGDTSKKTQSVRLSMLPDTRRLPATAPLKPPADRRFAAKQKAAMETPAAAEKQPPAPPVPTTGKRAAASSPDGSVIVPVKLPAPQPPSIRRSPPASTSNIALTRETQSMRAVQAADESPAADNETPSPAQAAPPDEAPTAGPSPSHEEPS
ncbi:MAG: hypothetical protein JW966_01820 [Anaerolineae bacterium]|nr:hypothetical protein [Anaerolineae bacterium]